MCLSNVLSPVFFAFIFHCRSFSPCWPLAFLIRAIYKKKNKTRLKLDANFLYKRHISSKIRRGLAKTLLSGAPARPKRARSGAPWVRKFGKLSIPENLVMTQRTSVRTEFPGSGKQSAWILGVGESRDFLAGNRMAQRRAIISRNWF